MSFKDLNAPDLVKQWRKLVNDNVSMGRDAHMIKEFLKIATPVQILCGMYQYKDVRTVSIPQFLRQSESWLIDDESWAGIELARQISHSTPPAWYEYHDLLEEETATAFGRAHSAKQQLLEWADKILA